MFFKYLLFDIQITYNNCCKLYYKSVSYTLKNINECHLMFFQSLTLVTIINLDLNLNEK